MKGIIINQDTDGILKGFRHHVPTLDDIIGFPRQFEGSHVTDYFICVCSEIVTFPSKKYTSVLDKYYRKEENGVSVDYSDAVNAKAAKYIFEDLGVDHNQIFIDEFRKIGINAWLSFRMNDIHYKNPVKYPTHFCHSDFYYDHPEYRRVKFHPEFTLNGGDHSYDYYYDEVREHFLGIIDEALDRYDPYGIELDFQREVDVFGIGRQYVGVEIMNQFMREVREITNRYSEKYGHKIKIAVHVPGDIQICFDFGHDVMQWVRDGAVDMVIPAGRFESTDNDLPIKLWSGLLKPYGVELAAGAEEIMCPYPGHQGIGQNIETLAAFAANAYAQGADKVYFYNYFTSRAEKRFDKTTDYTKIPNANRWDAYWTVINTLGDPDKIQKCRRRHVVTYKDRFQFWEHGVIGRQLPVATGRTISFKISVGEIPENSKVTVRLGVADGERTAANPPKLFVNSEPAEFIGVETDPLYTEHKLLCYDVPASVHNLYHICPFVITSEPIDIRYVDAHIEPPESI